MERRPLFSLSWAPAAVVDASALAMLGFFVDVRFLIGAVLAGKLLAERLGSRAKHNSSHQPHFSQNRRGHGAEGKPAPADAEENRLRLAAALTDMQRQLEEAKAAATRAEKRLQETEQAGKQREYTVLMLDDGVSNKGAEVELTALREQLRSSVAQATQDTLAAAAENERLLQQNEQALQQLRSLAGAMEQHAAAAAGREAVAAANAAAQQQQQQQRQESGPQGRVQQQQQELQQLQGGGDGPGQQPAASSGEEAQLRRELEEARAQLAAALSENTELEARLLHMAFDSHPLNPASPPPAGPASVLSPRGGIPLCEDGEFRRAASASAFTLQRELFQAPLAPMPNRQGNHQDSSLPAAAPNGFPDAAESQMAAVGKGAKLPGAAVMEKQKSAAAGNGWHRQ